MPSSRHALTRRRARQLALAAATAAGLAGVAAAPHAAIAAPGSDAGAGAAAKKQPATKRPAAGRFDARTTARLDRALRTTLARTWVPGVIAGVWVGDRGWTAVGGVADRATGRAPRLSARTRIGSVTKTFTGTLILQLVDEGRVRLDDTIERWFPGFPGASGITIRQLGTMSSGIASYSLDPATTADYLARPEAAWAPRQLIAVGGALPRRFGPGEGFEYSNTNFLMLGEIVEQVTGRPLATVMQERLFGPLKMRSTTYRTLTRLPSPSLRGSTLQGGDGSVLDATDWNPTFAGAAGQIVSTLGDLRTWTRAVGSGSLLKLATRREHLRPNPHSVGGGRAYAFGVGTAGGWVLHSGVMPGYNSQIAYLPKRRAAIVVLTNADIAGPQGAPAPAIFNALAAVAAPGSLPAG